MNPTSRRCAAFLALYYGVNALYQGYISKYFQQLGVSDYELMLLLVSFPLMALIFQPLWGMLSDHARSKNAVLLLITGVSCALIPFYSRMPAFGWLLALSCAFSAFYTAIQPLGDSLVLQSLQKANAPYCPVRLRGCISFAIVNLSAGYALRGSYQTVPLLVSAGLFLLFAAACFLPRCEKQPDTRPARFFDTLRTPYMLPLLALLMPLQLAMGYFYSYFSLYFTALQGGSSSLLGLAYFLSSASEIPFLLLGDRLYERHGAGRLMLVSAAALALRFALLGFTSHVIIALASQLLHGLGFIVMTVCMAKFVSRAVPESLRASGQTVVSVVGFGISRVFGVLGGGLISHRLGIPAGFVMISGVCLLSFLCAAPYFLRRPPLTDA